MLVLAVRNVKVRYKQTALGVGWALLQPLAGVAIFTVVMHRVAHVQSAGIPYPVFAYAGLAIWLYFTNGATAAAESLAQYGDLVTKVYFPRLLAPLAAVLPGLFDLAISTVAVGVFMVIFGVTPSVAIVLLPFWAAAAVATTFAVGMWLSALNHGTATSGTLSPSCSGPAVRDACPLSELASRRTEAFLLYLNPMAGVVDGFRWSLVGSTPSGSRGRRLARNGVLRPAHRPRLLRTRPATLRGLRLAMRSVEVNDVAKRYRIGESSRPTLRDAVSLRRSATTRDFWALDGVSFTADEGEVIGVIGRNGAGKTTLLKVISRITEPTRGVARMRGRVGSLLEVGTGFHPELTGRDNVFLNGAILGMRRAEIGKRFDDIVAFAGVEKFLDTPVKRYSSGMYLRLAFAVAAHVEPDIVAVDEVLAVGDAEFQRRCLGKMSQFARDGRTVFFVSHDLGAVAQMCQRVIWLDAGGSTRTARPRAASTSTSPRGRARRRRSSFPSTRIRTCG